MIDLDKLRSEFKSRFGGDARLFRAPGRVNLIGEHTDYNQGFVLPAALDLAVYTAVAPRADRKIRVSSVNFDGGAEFSLDDVNFSETNWTKYIQGIGIILEREGFRLNGADLLIESDVPVGAGLSSSAALEVSTAFALSTLAGYEIDGMQLAHIGQTAEHEFAGVRTGIMDQFVSVFGIADHALFLDCQSLDWSPVSLSNASFLICNTKIKHDLAESEYNRRRTECEQAAAFFAVHSLREVSLDQLRSKANEIDRVLMKRARHVLTENERVLNSIDALEEGDLVEFGRLLSSSHESLREDFEVSCWELDLMVDIAMSQGGVLGARMTGGGFGGCTINLIDRSAGEDLKSAISAAYLSETGIVPEIYSCAIGNGAAEITD